MLLEKLNQSIILCQKCSLAKNRKTVVFGEGGLKTKIMFIGEAPGQKEDEFGHPFMGAAGKFLDKMLKNIHLEKKDVFITNIIKCHPPTNRDPLPEEVSACWPWLLEQIKIIQPSLIITLGRHSMNLFFPEYKISQVHGKLLYQEIPKIGHQLFLVLYHPAVALYNGSMREILIKDFKKIPKLLKKINLK